MTEQQLRAKFVQIAQSYIGVKKGSGAHKAIIDRYNAAKPKGYYKMTYNDPWCATFVSNCSIEAILTEIIPMECSCSRQIELFKKLGTWHEDENYVPQPGDIIYYDWQDGTNYAASDNKGSADHVGIVEVVNGNVITAIEGNANNAVRRLGYKVNGRYLRGFGTPDFKKLATATLGTTKTPESIVVASLIIPTGKVTATQAAKSVDKSLSGTYVVTANSGLRIRDGAGTNFDSFMVLPLNTEVKNYGYYNEDEEGQRWMYVQVPYGGVVYTGYCSNAYLTKK